MARKTKDKVKEEHKPFNTGALHPGGGGGAGTKVALPEEEHKALPLDMENKVWN